ncbi:PAS domain-containing protein [Nitrospira defluvii]|nr:PAS domain-containing protein [Nitrospira defluvii]
MKVYFFILVLLGLCSTLFVYLLDEGAWQIDELNSSLTQKEEIRKSHILKRQAIQSNRKNHEMYWPALSTVSTGQGVVLTKVVSMTSETDKSSDFLFILLKVFGVIGMGLFGYSLIRTYFSSQAIVKKKKEKEVKEGKSDFIINTFQGLIQELKEKEEELEGLRKAAEERAIRVESYNDNILQSVPSGVLTVNREKIITTFNHAAETILGLPEKTVLNRSYEAVFGKNQKMVRLLAETLEKETDLLRQECEINRSAEKKIWLGLNTSLLRDRDERIIGATLVFTDLTEKKMLEEQVALKKRLEMMGEMSAWIAHEFRNYMSTILGYARLLGKKLEEDDPRKAMIQSVTDELAAMERLITELLSYSKKREIRAEPMVLASLIDEIVKQFSEKESNACICFTTSYEEGLPDVELDPILMRQVFSNLIQNGIESINGEGVIHINAFSRTARRIQIEVTDTGPGISEEHFDKVLLPFFTTKEKGTGLGLALVHKIVLSHNGHITVDSLQGKGTTFIIVLPVNQP